MRLTLVPLLALAFAHPAEALDGRLLKDLRPGAKALGYGSWTDWSGDYDGDGIEDLVVGAWGGEQELGSVQVIRSSGGPLWLDTGELGDGFGIFAGSVGDVTGDGRDDLAVGAPYGRGGGRWIGGTLYLYSGVDVGSDDAGRDTIEPVFRAHGEATGDRMGWNACALGDLDGDGYGDMAVGAPYGANLDGWVAVFGGGPRGAMRWRISLPNDAVNLGQMGTRVALVGDLDGDGRDDFGVGVPLKRIWGGGDERRPQVWIYLARDMPSRAPSYRLWGTDFRRLFGWDFAGIGDVDGDGYDDLAVGAPRKRSAPPTGPVPPEPPGVRGTDQGKVWIYRGGAEPDTIPYARLVGESPDDAFGNAVVGLGDVDGDGHTDFAVGAPGNDGGAREGGAVYLFLGGAPPDTVPDLLYRAEKDSARFGYSVGARGPAAACGPNQAAVGAIDGGFTLVIGVQGEGAPEPE